MKLDAGLKELERQFSLCIKCKQCTYGSWPKNLPTCPINDQYKFFTYSGGGIIYLARGILLNLIERESYKEVLDVLFKCTGCGYCGQTCKLVKVGPPYQNVTDLIRLMKINLVKQQGFVSQKHQQAVETIKTKHRPFDPEAEEKGLRELRKKTPGRGKVLLFSGCVSSYKRRERLEAAIDILNKSGIDYHLMDSEWCCGAPLIDLGVVDGIGELAEHNLQAIHRAGVEKVVFLCPHCQEAFKNTYPQVTGKENGFELEFFSKYLNGLMDKGSIPAPKQTPGKVSYHDSCYLGRFLGDFDSVRDLLGRIPKIELVEMEGAKEDAYCCGAGAGTRLMDPENSNAIGLKRMKDFARTEADVLATSCPMCKSQFIDLTKYAGKKIVVKDVIELLRDALI